MYTQKFYQAKCGSSWSYHRNKKTLPQRWKQYGRLYCEQK